jgi:hypothetical protein
MRLFRLFIFTSVLVGVIPSTATASNPAKSLQGLFSADDCEVVPQIEGVWTDASEPYSIRKIDDNKYRMIDEEVDRETGRKLAFDVCLAHVDGHLFYDATVQVLRQGDEPTLPPNFVVVVHNDVFDLLAGSWMPIHTIGRLEIEKNALHFRRLDDKWLQDVLKSRLVSVTSARDDAGAYFLTAASKELKVFVARFATDTKAFSDLQDYTRVPEGQPNGPH